MEHGPRIDLYGYIMCEVQAALMQRREEIAGENLDRVSSASSSGFSISTLIFIECFSRCRETSFASHQIIGSIFGLDGCSIW